MKRRREEEMGSGSDGGLDALGRVSKLRELLRARGLTAYMVPSEDAHMSEYVASCDKRRHYMTGFTGSAGVALITLTEAYCWTDGRYYVQAANELDATVFTMMRMYEDPPLEEWAATNLASGSVIGVDSGTISMASMKRLLAAVRRLSSPEQVTVKALPQGDNLVDLVWGSARPSAPSSTVYRHDVRYAGEAVAAKLARVRNTMKERDVGCHIVGALDEVAWLLNLRGSDVSYNPVFWSYVVIIMDRCILYCDSSRFAPDVEAALEKDGVSVRPYDSIIADLETMQLPTGASVWVDPNICNYGIQQVLVRRMGEARVELLSRMGPVQIMKAAKNEVELAGMRAAHLRDGVALVTFLAWLENEILKLGNEPTECEAADKLDGLRAAQDLFVSLSFPTISSADANGAIIHYRPLPASCAKITRDTMYLVDSGGQYRDGTTDVTRTLHMGTPTAWERECFTRVLRGHIALQRAAFPKGTTGIALDPLARAPLWEGGIDYKHGTGHGVGSFLNVHEGPHVISHRAAALETPLAPGYITSNEPGYYEDGQFGIRIENLCVVETADLDTPCTREKPYFKFGNLTLAPMQAKLIDCDMLTTAELQWLNEYHQHVYHTLSPRLQEEHSKQALDWLKINTRPLRQSK